jgi:hypothetical protein
MFLPSRLHIFAPFNPELLGALWLVKQKFQWKNPTIWSWDLCARICPECRILHHLPPIKYFLQCTYHNTHTSVRKSQKYLVVIWTT